MTKRLFSSIAVLMILFVAACAAPAQQESQPVGSSAAETGGAVVFSDPILEQMVREAMGKPQGDITATEAAAVKRLHLSLEWQRYLSDAAPIQNISGLECFINLESLDLSYHAITDITPLAEMTKLTALSLEGNPIADLTPLAGLTNLKALLLSNCAAQDYGPLAALVNLELLKLDQSTIADVSPLASLAKLKRLYLAGSPIDDYTPLENVYKNLEEKDFIFNTASSLTELGFIKNDGGTQALYFGQDVSLRIHHSEWGAAPIDWETNCIWLSCQMEGGYTLDVGFYAEIDAYVFQMIQNGEMLMNYVYDTANDSLSIGPEDRERSETVLHAALGENYAEDPLLAPIQIFKDAIKNTFGISAAVLYALPFDPPTLVNQGFVFFTDEEGNASYTYQVHEPHDMHISIYRQPWGYSHDDRSIEFYDDDINGYQLLILYFADEERYSINLLRGEAACSFDRYVSGEKCGESPDWDTVSRMFNEAFLAEGEGFYDKPLDYFEQVVRESFHMSIDELYALPVGE